MFGLREPNIKSHSHFQGDPISVTWIGFEPMTLSLEG